ncbi:hypothetical protein FEM08_25090 [Flavobacterium gilvum]|nr:hypothetical protein FEM08_25090 [Flavobacterium gilvum]
MVKKVTFFIISFFKKSLINFNYFIKLCLFISKYFNFWSYSFPDFRIYNYIYFLFFKVLVK